MRTAAVLTSCDPRILRSSYRRQFITAAAPSLYDQVGVRAALGCDALTRTVSASPRHGDLRLPSLILAVPRRIIPHLHLLASPALESLVHV